MDTTQNIDNGTNKNIYFRKVNILLPTSLHCSKVKAGE